MMDINAKQPGDNVIAVEEVPWADVSRYGVVGYSQVNGGTMAIQEMIEKPAHGDAPSNCIISGRYILQPEIFSKIAALKPGAGGEIQLTDALVALMEEQDFWGFKFERETYDCGDKLGFLLANVAYGLDREDIGPAFRGPSPDAWRTLTPGRLFYPKLTLDCARSAQGRTDCRLMRGVVEPIRRKPVKSARLFKE